jgi:flagellar hook-associated protein 3 FlgL
MRIADSTFFGRMRTALMGRRSDLATAQQRAETGLRVAAPSDDPIASALARKETSAAQRQSAYQKGADEAMTKLATADSTLGSVHDALLQAHDLSIQAANDTLNATDRASLANQVAQIRANVLSLANTEQEGHFIFAGYKDGAQPFDAAGVYNGDTTGPQLEVAKGVQLATGLTGDQVFKPVGGVDVLTALTNLQTALNANDTVGIQQAITDMGGAADHIADSRAQLGILMQNADMAKNVAQQAQDRATQRHADLVEIDPVAAYTDLAKAQSALQAAVAIAGQLPPPGLAATSRIGV